MEAHLRGARWREFRAVGHPARSCTNRGENLGNPQSIFLGERYDLWCWLWNRQPLHPSGYGWSSGVCQRYIVRHGGRSCKAGFAGIEGESTRAQVRGQGFGIHHREVWYRLLLGCSDPLSSRESGSNGDPSCIAGREEVNRELRPQDAVVQCVKKDRRIVSRTFESYQSIPARWGGCRESSQCSRVGGEETRDDRYQVLLFKVAWSCSCKITMKIELLIIFG